jgi:hypothetical protein
MKRTSTSAPVNTSEQPQESSATGTGKEKPETPSQPSVPVTDEYDNYWPWEL